MAVHNNLANLIEYYHEQKIAHAYLIETNDLDLCFQELKEVIKNINCPNEYQEKCSKCNLCQLLENNYLPSFIVLEPDGINIKKEQILDLKSRFSYVPTYTKENIYIIKQAESLNAASANTMLKFLEEPENAIIGFFLTNNVNNVINTIKSRCEVIKVNYGKNNATLWDSPYLENVYVYLKNIELKKASALMDNKTLLLNIYNDKNDYVNIFKLILTIYRKAIENKGEEQDSKYREKFAFLLEEDLEELIRKEKIISAYLEDLNYNVNMELFLDKFVIELSDINE